MVGMPKELHICICSQFRHHISGQTKICMWVKFTKCLAQIERLISKMRAPKTSLYMAKESPEKCLNVTLKAQCPKVYSIVKVIDKSKQIVVLVWIASGICLHFKN